MFILGPLHCSFIFLQRPFPDNGEHLTEDTIAFFPAADRLEHYIMQVIISTCADGTSDAYHRKLNLFRVRNLFLGFFLYFDIGLDADYLIKQQWPLLFIIPTSVSSFSKEVLKQLGWGIRPSRTCSEPLKQSTCSWENLVGVYYFALVKLCFTANLLLPGQPNLPHMEPIIFPAWTQQVLC
ncbi:hypothetical protein CQW23_35238 [Capsicum baccatum]|uniref:Uncharacterized protein n=1 Tax=Capsicum baccatum TaxID=33114 RepID=A0A2G2UWI2_CAPBA|nr:hypothetical protein CQW23_35238 [Capsicum baccatum]